MTQTEPVTDAEFLARGLAANGIGWAFPAALGAKCAAPKRKAICWSGDDALASNETVVVDVATNIDCRAPEPWLPEGA